MALAPTPFGRKKRITERCSLQDTFIAIYNVYNWHLSQWRHQNETHSWYSE